LAPTLRAIERGGYLTKRVFFADEATAIDRYSDWKACASGRPT
jgi:hypothetical protein